MATATPRNPGPSRTDAREQRVKRSLVNPIYFGEVYCRPYDPNWNEPLPAFAHDMLRFVAAAKGWPALGGVVMLPPEFLKTTLISQVYPLWRTARARLYNELLRGLLISEEEGMAKGNLAVIAWHLLNNERLHADFSDTRGRPLLVPDPDADVWRDDAIVVHRPNMISRDPTWQAKGVESKGIHGRRLDLCIGDDMVTPRSSSSPAKRKAALHAMETEIQTRVVEGGQIIVAGNFNDTNDLLSTLAKQRRYRLFKRPSLHKPGNPHEAPAESALWDEQHSVEAWPQNWHRRRLRHEYEAKPARFRRIHLLDPRAEGGERLQTSWVTLASEEMLAPLMQYAKFYMGVDGASGGDSENLDFFTVTVIAATQGHGDVVRSFAMRGTTPRRVELMSQLHDAFQRVGQGVAAIAAPKQHLDTYLTGAFTIVRPDLGHKLHPVSIPQSEANKEVRLEGLGPRAQAGWLRVLDTEWTARTSDAEDRHEELTLEEEWREFPYGAHDDRLDSLDIACRAADDGAVFGTLDFELDIAPAW